MKKVIMIIALFVGVICQAQDYTFLKGLKALPNEAEAVSLANTFAGMATSKLRLYKTKDTPNQHNLRLMYVPIEITDKEMERNQFTHDQALNFVTIDFVYYMEGENKDLEKPGVKMYRLSRIQTKYLNMFPVWQKYFNPNSDIEKTLSDYKSQHIKNAEYQVNYYIQKDGDLWVLNNQS